MKQSGISLKKMYIYNICLIVFLAIFMILTPYLSADATTAENQEIEAETISGDEQEESSEAIDNKNEDKLYEAEENQIPNENKNEDDNADIQKNIIGSWAKDGQGWHFYNSEGIMQKGFCTIDSKKYYFGNDGIMRTGWQNVEGCWYYFGGANDGSAKRNWQYIGGHWFFFESNYVMVSDTIKDISGNRYAFDAGGAMRTGWQNIDGRWYYFGGANDGSAKRNWQYIGGHWFFFESNYVMVSDTIKEISGNRYAFDAGGAMLSGTFKFKDNIYATTSSGAIKDSGWILYNSKWYYKESNSEIIKNSIRDICGLRYSFDADGVMRTRWQNVEGRWYYFGGANDGSAKRNWQYIGGHWFFFESNYVMVSDIIKEISGSKYAFDAGGAMLSGTFKFKDNIYATTSSGEIKDSGWILYNSKWYYKESNSDIIKNSIRDIGGSRYSFDADGVMRTGWQNVEGRWYYFGGANDGSAKRSWQSIGGRWYFFESNYVMVSDTIKNISGSSYAFDTSGAMLLGKFNFHNKTYVTDASGHLMLYDNSVEAKAREIASKLGYNIYKALNYCAGMSRYYLTKNGRTSNPIMSSAKYAMYGYKNYGGDCLVMASAFKYLAQACGYNCTQWFGWVGSSTHSWCEIGGYVYDPNFINATNRGKHGFHYGTKGTWRYRKSYKM